MITKDSVLSTLRLVPNDVMRLAATLPFDGNNGGSCYVGNVVRAALALRYNIAPAEVVYNGGDWDRDREFGVPLGGTPVYAAKLFGGTDTTDEDGEFAEIFGMHYFPEVKEAWETRVAEVW